MHDLDTVKNVLIDIPQKATQILKDYCEIFNEVISLRKDIFGVWEINDSCFRVSFARLDYQYNWILYVFDSDGIDNRETFDLPLDYLWTNDYKEDMRNSLTKQQKEFFKIVALQEENARKDTKRKLIKLMRELNMDSVDLFTLELEDL